MASKGGRDKIKLESTAGTGHFYTTTKNKKTMPEKMLIMKFDPKARKHVEYKSRASAWMVGGDANELGDVGGSLEEFSFLLNCLLP